MRRRADPSAPIELRRMRAYPEMGRLRERHVERRPPERVELDPRGPRRAASCASVASIFTLRPAGVDVPWARGIRKIAGSFTVSPGRYTPRSANSIPKGVSSPDGSSQAPCRRPTVDVARRVATSSRPRAERRRSGPGRRPLLVGRAGSAPPGSAASLGVRLGLEHLCPSLDTLDRRAADRLAVERRVTHTRLPKRLIFVVSPRIGHVADVNLRVRLRVLRRAPRPPRGENEGAAASVADQQRSVATFGSDRSRCRRRCAFVAH